MEGDIKYLMLLGIFIILIGISSAASPDFGTFKQTECFTLRQSCFINGTICDTCNISSITYPEDGSSVVSNVMMSKNVDDFNFSLCQLPRQGRYNVNGYCTYGSDVKRPFVAFFTITPSGKSGGANIVFFVFMIVAFYSINLFGFFGRNIYMTILGGMALMFLGVYMITNGIIVYRDNLTNYFSYVTISWGFLSAIWALFEQFEVI